MAAGMDSEDYFLGCTLVNSTSTFDVNSLQVLNLSSERYVHSVIESMQSWDQDRG